MAVGARDYIDQMLVKRYAKENVNNPEDATSMNITKERYWEIMKDIAQVHMAMVKVANTLKKGLSSPTPSKSQA